MNLARSTLTLALLAALVAPAAHAEIAIDSIADSEVSFEGLIQADGYWYDSDFINLDSDVGDGSDADSAMRRAELVLKGKGPGNIEWVLGYDAKADKWLDVNVKYKIRGNANHFFQAGQYKQMNSLEELSSTKNNDFISKAVTTNTFGIARRLGAMYQYGDNNWAIAGSIFTRELTEHPAPTPHGPGWGVRAYWAPINTTGSIFHIGASYNNYDTFGDSVQWRARPDADLAGVRLIDTGNLRNTDRIATTGLESFWVTGPFKLQGEYMTSTTDRYSGAAGDFKGTSGYLSGVWNITGETWGYKSGVPTTPLPNNPAAGMWQLGLRYDTIDLDDGNLVPGATPTAAPTVFGVLGGQMDTWTVGVNWYWRSNFKFMLNYVKVDSTRFIGRTSATFSEGPANNNRTFNAFLDDSPNIMEARLQFYW